MRVETVATTPFEGQRPGTSGLRKKVAVFQQPHYLENFVQSIFDVLGNVSGRSLVLGGDGRFHNRQALETIISMAVAHGFAELRVGRGGLLSTPAASAAIREHGALGGIVLSASHNPGGPKGDFGIKYNGENGGPAPASLTDAFYERTRRIAEYRIARDCMVDIDNVGETACGATRVVVFDPVDGYLDLMEKSFDLERIAALFEAGSLEVCFDAMNAVTGPYAHRILERRLGAPVGSVIRGEPLEDFGGSHPDPNLAHAHELATRMMGGGAPDFGAASDGDGDRNMIMGRRCFVTPSDSLAVMAANAHLLPGYRQGLSGVARSMPTSRAVDVVAAEFGVDCYETPTGWKYFGNLLDAGRITLCGEESFGTGSSHVREKDGLWAVLFWLNLLAVRRHSVAEIMADHWRRFGRHFYARHDYEALDATLAEDLMELLAGRLPSLPGTRIGSLQVSAADDFSYVDPVDHSTTEHQGLRVMFGDTGRIVFRLSGTGTEGATLRIYLERYMQDSGQHGRDVGEVLDDLVEVAELLCQVRARSGRRAPDVVT